MRPGICMCDVCVIDRLIAKHAEREGEIYSQREVLLERVRSSQMAPYQEFILATRVLANWRERNYADMLLIFALNYLREHARVLFLGVAYEEALIDNAIEDVLR